MSSPKGPTGTPQQDQQNNFNLLNLIRSAADVKSVWRVTQSAFVSVICPPAGCSTVDRTTTHRTAFFTALYYQHRLSLLPSKPPWTRMDTGLTIPTAGGDPLTWRWGGLLLTPRGSPGGLPSPWVQQVQISYNVESSPSASGKQEEEEEAPHLCLATLQTGTTGQIINNNKKISLITDMLGCTADHLCWF